MARTPKQVAQSIKDAQKRIDSAQKSKGKIALQYKPGMAPKAKPKQRVQEKEGLSINEIIRETTARTRQLGRIDNVSLRQFKKTRAGTAIMCETVSYKKTGAQHFYKQVVENLDDDTDLFYKSRWVIISCTCPQFQYTHDWTLHQAGSSNLEFSTDEASNIRNPRQLKGSCKHTLAVLNHIKSNRI